MTTLMAPGRSEAGPGLALSARTVAIVASLAAAAIYLLIGFGVVSVGTAADGSEAPGMFEFGAMAGLAMVVVAGLVWRFRSRALLLAVAAFEVLVIVFYVAVAGIRNPPFELWGLLIKGFQAVALVAVAAMLLRERRAPGTVR